MFGAAVFSRKNDIPDHVMAEAERIRKLNETQKSQVLSLTGLNPVLKIDDHQSKKKSSSKHLHTPIASSPFIVAMLVILACAGVAVIYMTNLPNSD